MRLQWVVRKPPGKPDVRQTEGSGKVHKRFAVLLAQLVLGHTRLSIPINTTRREKCNKARGRIPETQPQSQAPHGPRGATRAAGRFARTCEKLCDTRRVSL